MGLELRIDDEEGQAISPEEFLAGRKRSIRRQSWWALGVGGVVVAAHLVLFSLAVFSDQFEGFLTWRDLFKSIFFILGLFALVGGVWGLRYARTVTIEDYISTPEAVEFARQAELSKPYYTYFLIGLIVAVTLVQFPIGFEKSADIAGFDKIAFREKGEWWRILTGGALHGGILHIYFNAQALYGFGSLIEFLSNRAQLAIIFVLAVVGGGLLSLIFLPDGTSIGASGGIMGLIGYLAVFGYRRKQQLPPDFLKNMLINVGFIGAFGLVAWQIVDNFGHLGGLLAGAIYGFVQIPRDLHKNPRETNILIKIFGVLALAIFAAASLFSILLLLKNF